MACCILHNFIRRHQANNNIFSEEQDEPDAENEGEERDLLGVIDDSQNGEDLRANIANQLWSSRTLFSINLIIRVAEAEAEAEATHFGFVQRILTFARTPLAFLASDPAEAALRLFFFPLQLSSTASDNDAYLIHSRPSRPFPLPPPLPPPPSPTTMPLR
uniref:Uncharacterized protein n=1 Tax=Ananas comosus var. bracteatus TaxID=296719 RepID=A0A6V7NFS0_ANACO|nr:unnamed protein product [Ananas comosus var. bracteatus]